MKKNLAPISAVLFISTLLLGCQSNDVPETTSKSRDLAALIGSKPDDLCAFSYQVMERFKDEVTGRKISIGSVQDLDVERIVTPDEQFGNMALNRISGSLKWNGLTVSHIDYFGVSNSDWLSVTIYLEETPNKVKEVLKQNGATMMLGALLGYKEEKSDGFVAYEAIRVSVANNYFPAGTNASITCETVDKDGNSIGL